MGNPLTDTLYFHLLGANVALFLTCKFACLDTGVTLFSAGRMTFFELEANEEPDEANKDDKGVRIEPNMMVCIQ